MLPFSPPHIDQKIIDEVTDTLKSGWITTGPKTKRFEKELTRYCGNKNTLCVNSATAGMELVLRWFGVGEGDEVIVPAYTYCATANVVVHCGAKPVIVDVGDDFNIRPENIRKLITSKTKAIMPVDIGGYPCDYDQINQMVREEQIKNQFIPHTPEQEKLGRILVLSDAAHSFGATYKNNTAGKLTDISVFSFHAVKNLTTAEGGAIALNLPEPFDNEAIYNYLCTLSLHGQNKDALAKTKAGGWKYDVIEAGYKCNMTDIQASIGLVELERYKQQTLKRRKEIFSAYTQKLSLLPWAIIPPFQSDDRESSYHIFLLRIKDISEQQRDNIIERIVGRKVSVNVHFQPLPLLSAYKNMGYDIKKFPVAFDNYQKEITLPVYFDLFNEDIDTVITTVIQSVEEEIGRLS